MPFFYALYPERKNQKLGRGTPEARIWISIRDKVVLPLLRNPPPPPIKVRRREPPSHSSPELDQAMHLIETGEKTLGRLWLDLDAVPAEKPHRFPPEKASYRFTACDLLWTARLLMGEAGSKTLGQHPALVHTMFNDFILTRYPLGHASNFSNKLRNYSTPLQNPLKNKRVAWRQYNKNRRTFVRYKPDLWYSKAKPPENKCVPVGNSLRHIRIQQTKWQDIDNRIRLLAFLALNGDLENPGIGNATKFMNTTMLYRDEIGGGRKPNREQWKQYSSKKKGARKNWAWIGDQKDTLEQYESNAFYVEDRYANIPTSAIRIEGGDRR